MIDSESTIRKCTHNSAIFDVDFMKKIRMSAAATVSAVVVMVMVHNCAISDVYDEPYVSIFNSTFFLSFWPLSIIPCSYTTLIRTCTQTNTNMSLLTVHIVYNCDF